MTKAARLLARRDKSKGKRAGGRKKLQRGILLDARNGARQILRLRSFTEHFRALLVRRPPVWRAKLWGSIRQREKGRRRPHI